MKKILVVLAIVTTQNLIAQSAKELNSKGIEFAKKGKIDKAFSIFNNAIQQYPDSPGPYSNRGNIYRIRKEYDLAIQDYSKSLELNSENLDVLYARANTYLDMADFEMAIADYTTIIDKNPSYPNIYFDRAYARIRLEKYSDAKSDLESQFQLTPKDFKSLANLINIKKILELYDEALSDYEKLLKEFPNQPNLHIVYNNKANLHRKLDQLDDALLNINKALEIKRNYDIGLFNRACIYLALEEEKKACDDFKNALKLNLEKNEHFQVDKDFEKLKEICQ